MVDSTPSLSSPGQHLTLLGFGRQSQPGRTEKPTHRSPERMSNKRYDHIAHIYLQVESFFDRSWSWSVRVLSRLTFVGDSGLVSKALEIENLKVQIARLQRMQFVRSSKNFADDVGPLVLRLKELGVVPNSDGPA